ncbi:MAG: DsbA family protein [Rickettsiales bacterium]|nr:DsbA family protein [Rickettsiales bacterium]
MSKDNPDKDTENKNALEEEFKGSSEGDDENDSKEGAEETTEYSHEDDMQQDTEDNQGFQHEGSAPQNDTGGNSKKMRWSYIALIVVVAAVVLFGVRGKFLRYFSGESKTKAPKVVRNKLPSPTPSPVVPAATKAQDKPAQIIQQKSLTEDDVKNITKDFILNNPEVIMESVARLEKKASEEKAKKSEEFLSKSGGSLTEGKPFIGNKNGTSNIIEFFDYKCIHCHKVYPQLVKLINEYPNLKISLVPLPFMGADSTKATRFSLAVNNLYPDKFYAFHSDLIKSNSINEGTIFTLISKYNLDKDKLVQEANSKRVDDLIKENLNLAQKSGVQGVPSFVINGKFISGAMSYEKFKELIDQSKPTPEK